MNCLAGRHPPPLDSLAAGLGSDVNFFLQEGPALATGGVNGFNRCPLFTCLTGHALLMFHPGSGVPTPWAFKALSAFPTLRDGKPGRASAVAERFGRGRRPRRGRTVV